eukprot:gene17892-25020_t
MNKLTPLVITSSLFSNKHRATKYHVECPERVSSSTKNLDLIAKDGKIILKDIEIELQDEIQQTKLTKARDIIHLVHDKEYINEISDLCNKGARMISPWDLDTFLSRDSFTVCLHAQLAWIEGIDEVLKNKNMAFALTRPPGHHALYSTSCGFCIFNFAVGAALYALQEYKLDRIAILDFDVHFGNGIADLVRNNPKIRYCSIHQDEIFPYNEGKIDDT